MNIEGDKIYFFIKEIVEHKRINGEICLRVRWKDPRRPDSWVKHKYLPEVRINEFTDDDVQSQNLYSQSQVRNPGAICVPSSNQIINMEAVSLDSYNKMQELRNNTPPYIRNKNPSITSSYNFPELNAPNGQHILLYNHPQIGYPYNIPQDQMMVNMYNQQSVQKLGPIPVNYTAIPGNLIPVYVRVNPNQPPMRHTSLIVPKKPSNLSNQGINMRDNSLVNNRAQRMYSSAAMKPNKYIYSPGPYQNTNVILMNKASTGSINQVYGQHANVDHVQQDITNLSNNISPYNSNNNSRKSSIRLGNHNEQMCNNVSMPLEVEHCNNISTTSQLNGMLSQKRIQTAIIGPSNMRYNNANDKRSYANLNYSISSKDSNMAGYYNLERTYSGQSYNTMSFITPDRTIHDHVGDFIQSNDSTQCTIFSLNPELPQTGAYHVKKDNREKETQNLGFNQHYINNNDQGALPTLEENEVEVKKEIIEQALAEQNKAIQIENNIQIKDDLVQRLSKNNYVIHENNSQINEKWVNVINNNALEILKTNKLLPPDNENYHTAIIMKAPSFNLDKVLEHEKLRPIKLLVKELYNDVAYKSYIGAILYYFMTVNIEAKIKIVTCLKNIFKLNKLEPHFFLSFVLELKKALVELNKGASTSLCFNFIPYVPKSAYLNLIIKPYNKMKKGNIKAIEYKYISPSGKIYYKVRYNNGSKAKVPLTQLKCKFKILEEFDHNFHFKFK